jgi:hypothetical protein
MPSESDFVKMTVQEFANRFRAEMVPLSNFFSYFAAMPLAEDEVKEYLEDPIAALPPSLKSAAPRKAILLVPYLEKANGEKAELVAFEKPPENRQAWASQFVAQGEATLVFGIKDPEVADYHYHFYRAMAELTAGTWEGEAQSRFSSLLREELRAEVHGEVDEEGWHLKQTLLRRQADARRETKLFREYARQCFIDTLTLYLHGICCDIDVETGPRQLPSRYLRARLELLTELYPPPEGFAVFPEDLNK